MSFMVWRSPNISSENIFLSHASSFEAAAVTRHSVSTVDCANVFCLLLLHEIILPPLRTQYSGVDLLFEGDQGQSASK